MKCIHCGADLVEGTYYCNFCGAPQENTLNQTSPWAQNYQTPNVQTKKPGLGFSIASLACGIISIFTLQIILAVLAIVFGIIAQNKDSKSGMAKAGVVCGVIAIILNIVLVYILCSMFEGILTAFASACTVQ